MKPQEHKILRFFITYSTMLRISIFRYLTAPQPEQI